MKATVIELSDELVEGLRQYALGQNPHPDLSTAAQQAIRAFLAGRGLLAPQPGLRITPVARGSGFGDLSVGHDRYFAE